MDEVREEEADPEGFFGEVGTSRKRTWKVLQLCRQVERAATVALLAECESEALSGACVASVEPAPDASRLRVTIVLAGAVTAEQVGDARAALARSTGLFRNEVARCIHRKRVPEIVFDVQLAGRPTGG